MGKEVPARTAGGGRGFTQPVDTAGPQDPALYQAHRLQGHLGGAAAKRRNRIPG